MIDREKVARAIGEVYDGYADPVETPNNWARATSAADAAIAAVLEQLREPSDAVLIAGYDEMSDYREAMDTEAVWSAMLDAAFLQPADQSNPAE